MRALTADTPGGAALRRLVPAVVVVPMGLAALRLAGERAGLYPTAVGLSLLDTAIIALALPLASRLARSLDRADAHRRQADALRENEERARRIVDAAHDAFVAVDANGTICGWDHASERLCSATPSKRR